MGASSLPHISCVYLSNLLLMLLLVHVTALSVRGSPAQEFYVSGDALGRFDGWTLEEAKMSGIGFCPAVMSLGRYIFLLGGVLEQSRRTGLAHFVTHQVGRGINVWDHQAHRFVTNVRQICHHDGNVSDTNDCPGTYLGQAPPFASLTGANLAVPVVGSTAAVRSGSVVYLIGPCNMIPNGVEIGKSDIGDDAVRRYLLSIQSLRLYAERFPETEDVTIEISNWTLPGDTPLRYNASCIAGESGSIFIIGGVNAETGEEVDTVTQYNTSSNTLVQAVWSLPQSVVTPGLASGSELIFIAGGFSAHSNLLFSSIETRQDVGILNAQRKFFTPHVAVYTLEPLGWTSPFIVAHNRTLIVCGTTDGTTYDGFSYWPDMTVDGSSLFHPSPFQYLPVHFAPQRRYAAVATLPQLHNITWFLFGGQVPPPTGRGTGAVSDVFTGIMHISPSITAIPSTNLRVDGFAYTTEIIEAKNGTKGARATSTWANPRHGPRRTVFDPSPGVPNNMGNITITVNGYLPLWYNWSFQLLLDEVDDAMDGICPGMLPRSVASSMTNTSEPRKPNPHRMGDHSLDTVERNHSKCLLSISTSPSCDVPLLELGPLGPGNARRVSIMRPRNGIHDEGGEAQRDVITAVALGEMAIIGSLEKGILSIRYTNWKGEVTERTIDGDWQVNDGRRTNVWRVRHGDAAYNRMKGNYGGNRWNSKPTSRDDPEKATSFFPQNFVYVCFSTESGTVASCGSERDDIRDASDLDESTGRCRTSFYVPLNAHQPFVLSPVTNWMPDRPTPPPVNPANTGPSLVLLGSLLVTLLLLCICVILACCCARVAYEKVGQEANDDNAPLLSIDEANSSPVSLWCGVRGHSSAATAQRGGAGPGAAIPQDQERGLLDNKYRVVRRLGKGSFSVVYLVTRVSDGRRFALKYVQCADEVDRDEAMHECEIVYRLQGHPNVIQLIDMFMSYKFDHNMSRPDPPRRSNSDLFVSHDEVAEGRKRVEVPPVATLPGERYLSLVMAYHAKGDLSRWVQQQKASNVAIPEMTVVSIAYQVLSVLHFMHRRAPPILHRDLKPENILLDATARNGDGICPLFLPVVVTDFGLSRVLDKTFCETGVGSLPYVAPECWQRRYSAKVDLWALGCILYAVCTKRVGSDNVRVMFSDSGRSDFSVRLQEEISCTYGYSSALAHFIASLLEVNPSKRPSAAEALGWVGALPLSPSHPTHGDTTARRVHPDGLRLCIQDNIPAVHRVKDERAVGTVAERVAGEGVHSSRRL